MEKKQFHRRGLGMLLLLAVILFGLGSSLYDAQMIHGAEYLARSQNSIAETQTVEAARGDILDRYGRVLVSNRVTYQVALNTDAMEKNRNDILLALIRIARDAGVEWEDTLPITAQPPFRYTTDTPFQYPTTDEEGSPTTSLTRLGRLAVKMKWIDDPTADGAQGAPLPTAEELLEKMRESFQLELEGADMRAVAGVLYELYYRSMVNSWPPYVFAEGVDIDFISKVKEPRASPAWRSRPPPSAPTTPNTLPICWAGWGPLRTGMHIRTWIWTGTARRTMRWTTLSARRGRAGFRVLPAGHRRGPGGGAEYQRQGGVREVDHRPPAGGQRGAHHRHRPSEAGGGHPLPGYSPAGQ